MGLIKERTLSSNILIATPYDAMGSGVLIILCDDGYGREFFVYV